jgi:anti-sigma factor RsiW
VGKGRIGVIIDGHTILLLNAYHDGELSTLEMLAMQKRLAAEPELRAFAEELGILSVRLEALRATDSVPQNLRDKIFSEIGLSEEARVVQIPKPRKSRPFTWMAMAASLVLGIGLGAWVAGPLSPWPFQREPSIADMVFAAHLRGLAASQPFDIASSDRHVVKPWFNGRTTIAPTAPDLASDGFPLIGGRIDIVRDMAVPTLVYRHDRHVISVTVIASTPEVGDGEEVHDGSMMQRFVAGNLTYLAVSDLNGTDLGKFMTLLKKAVR